MKTSQVEELVKENPGMTFSEIKRELDMENGQLQYHLKQSNLIQKKKGYVDPENCSNCAMSEKCGEKCVKQVLRNKKRRRICFLLEKDIEKNKIAEKLEISPSTLTYHLNKLKSSNIIKNENITEQAASIINQTA